MSEPIGMTPGPTAVPSASGFAGADPEFERLDLPGIWRYLPLLDIDANVAEPLARVDQPEVLPPREAPGLARELGVAAVWLLPCTGGPTGSFKDVEAAVVLARRLEAGGPTRRLVFASSGNTARAYRCYALRAGFPSTSCFPLAALEKWRGVSADPRAELVAVDGDALAVANVAERESGRDGAEAFAPIEWRLEGKAALAYAISEHVPAAGVVAQTIAGGIGPLGMCRGFERLHGLGFGPGPRFELFQVRGQATLASWLRRRGRLDPGDLELPAEPFEQTLLSTGPLATAEPIAAMVDCGRATVTVVGPDRIADSAPALTAAAAAAGIEIAYRDERSPFVSWAGLLERREHLSASDEVVLVLTGGRPRTGELPRPDRVLRPAPEARP